MCIRDSYYTGRYAEALAAVRKAIELNPTEDRLRENEKYILAALK